MNNLNLSLCEVHVTSVKWLLLKVNENNNHIQKTVSNSIRKLIISNLLLMYLWWSNYEINTGKIRKSHAKIIKNII